MATLTLLARPSTGGEQQAAAADVLVGSTLQSHASTALTLTGLSGVTLQTTGTDTQVTLTSKASDGASAIGIVCNNNAALANATARLLTLKNNGTEKLAVLATGGLIAPTVGPNATNQHTLPGVTSGNVLIDTATQTLTNKTIGVSQLSGQVSVPNGGTGASTLTAHGVVMGNATSAVNVSSAGTAGQVFTSGGAGSDGAYADPVTATQSTSSLGTTQYDITTNDTYEDVGLSVTLPAAGTYLVWANVRQGVQISASPNAVITTKFRNSTDSADVANSERIGVVATQNNIVATGTVCMQEVVTVAASKTIKLYAQRNSGPTYTSSFLYTDSGGRSRMGYIKLAPS